MIIVRHFADALSSISYDFATLTYLLFKSHVLYYLESQFPLYLRGDSDGHLK